MLWATVIPIGVIFCPYALYETACVHETDASWKTLELHWRHTRNETDFPDGFTREGILLRGLNPACPSTPSLLLTSARAHALGTDGLMSRWPCASVQIAFLVVLLIDIIIPAGEHAAELNMPPPVPLNSVSISTTPIIQRWLVVASSTVAELVLIGKQPPSRETLDIFVESVCYHNALMTTAKSEEAGSRWEVAGSRW